MLRWRDQLRLTKPEGDLLAERVRFVPEGIRSEQDLRDWFARVKCYYSQSYGAGSSMDLSAREELDQELSRLLVAT
jgi:hypothetical protein